MSLNRLRPIVPTAQVGSFMSSSIGIPSAAGTFRFSSLVPIAWTQLSAATSSVLFSGIPQNFQDLRIIASARTSTSTADDMTLRLNADSATNYSRTVLYSDNASAVSFRNTNSNWAIVGFMPSNSDTAGVFSTQSIDIFNYASTTVNKTILGRSGMSGTASTIGNVANVALWRNTAAINSVTLLAANQSFASGSTFALYGVLAS